ncbi:hypothetical protein NQ318_007870 [Aromia moschata]|uniref:Methyltransferase type 11 domain-containing protein n=1 Tax=Aromia moschata TaxID=1265417 RepID=A0AAV8XM27_9CUCU|nr:hypothetical protein NQ318_007870 [Aromia moschata]
MNLLPKSKEDFSQSDYWESFFKKRGTKTFEWYGEYPELSEYLHNNITNIDISQVAIRQMLSQNGKSRTNLKYLQMDALNMTFSDAQFSVVLDKGTLDALMPDDSEETLSKIIKYFNEIQRVLKIGGRYICISLLQDHILKAILNYFPNNNWMFRVSRCHDVERKAVEVGENSMPVFFVVCTKFNSLPQKVLEINLGSLGKMQRLESEEDVILHISSVQHAAFVCSGLKNCSVENENEVVLDLLEPDQSNPRFTVYIVDIPPQRNNAQYAAFIVPQGREAEWLFSTKAGRKHLVKMTKHNRLAIITLHRGQKYESFDAVQTELTNTVCNLAPSSLTNKKIPFLSLGADVGKRAVRYEGRSDFSGDYSFSLKAKLKTIKTRKGVAKEIVDLLYLTCKHHVYMSLAAYIACSGKKKSILSVIGLGGGGLCSFLHKFLPKTDIIGVEIDADMLKIATDWFGFQQNDKLKVRIMDGLKYLQETAETGEKLDAILFDVDSKDTSVGMSCPPKLFLENDVLNSVAQIINKEGLFILNMVLRDESLRPTILSNLKKYFAYLVSYKLNEDLNEIVICSNTAIIMDKLKEACRQTNSFFKRNNISNNDLDVDEFMESLVLQ